MKHLLSSSYIPQSEIGNMRLNDVSDMIFCLKGTRDLVRSYIFDISHKCTTFFRSVCTNAQSIQRSEILVLHIEARTRWRKLKDGPWRHLGEPLRLLAQEMNTSTHIWDMLKRRALMYNDIFGKLVWTPWSLKADEFNLDEKENHSGLLMKLVFQEDESVSRR